MSEHRVGLQLRVILVFLGTMVFCAGAQAGPTLPDQELLNSWGVYQIGAGRVHEMGITGASVKVGIIDSGIDYTHPELSGSYAGGYDFVFGDDDPFDDAGGHGTQVAGIIGAADDGQGIVGVAPGASLYAYKVYHGSTDENTLGRIIAALERAVVDGMQVVNLSMGFTLDAGSELLAACTAAVQAGITVVASAGNDGLAPNPEGNIHYPAAYDSVIAVGSTDMLDMRSSYSNTGPQLELVAPGEEVLTTDRYLLPGLANLTSVSGTSFAAPHVAGTAALLIEAGYTDVRSRLIYTAVDLGSPGFDELYGYGRVDAYGAVVVPLPAAAVLALLGLPLAQRIGRSQQRS